MADPERRLNVIFFHHTRADRYMEWARKNFRDEIEYHFGVSSAVDFTEITKNSGGAWDIVLVESSLLLDDAVRSVMAVFVKQNPNVSLGIEQQAVEDQAENVQDLSCLLYRAPDDEDEWLTIMHGLIAKARTGHNAMP